VLSGLYADQSGDRPGGVAGYERGAPAPLIPCNTENRMSLVETDEPPRGSVKIVYLGPVAPHWEVRGESSERGLIDGFRDRAMARLLLLPPHDPQFRRNRERVARDAERERLILSWDLGVPEEDDSAGS
jgi:hypothetical protein